MTIFYRCIAGLIICFALFGMINGANITATARSKVINNSRGLYGQELENAIKAQEQQGYIYIGASAGLIVIALKMFITAKKTDLLEKISFSLAAIERNTAAPVQSEEPDQK